MPASNHSYMAANFQLNLDGIDCGFLKSVDGGAITAEVFSETAGTNHFAAKHIGPPRYEEFVVQFGSNANRTIFDWIAASWTGNYARKDGSIVAANQKLEAINKREFQKALITETTIPAADAAAKAPAYFTLKFAPEYTRYTKASGKIASTTTKPQQKLWLPSNFRLTLDGLDCTKVSKMDAMTVKQNVARYESGGGRESFLVPTKLEFPNLRVTLPESAAQSWFDWFEDFLVMGNNGASGEKNGSLTMLSADLKEELARVDFFNVGIFKLAPEKAEAGSEQIRRVTAELYCERMELKVDGGAKSIPTQRTITRRLRRRSVSVTVGSSSKASSTKLVLGKHTRTSLSAATGPN